MADKYVNELPQETYNTLDGTEQFVMFDVAEGKRSALNTIGNYVLSKMTPDNLDKSVTGTISDMQEDISTLELAVGSPLMAETVSEMTDTTRIYVYVGNETGYTAGNWYYWDGSSWANGGVYNSAAVETDKTLLVSDKPADAKTVGDIFRNMTATDTTGEGDIVLSFGM